MAVVKHTHHPVNRASGGDTGRYLAAGAVASIFADDERSVVFRADSDPSEIVSYGAPSDLLEGITEAEIVLIEGFKSHTGWPRVLVRREGEESLDEDGVVAVVTDDELAAGVPVFHHDEIEEIASFVDEVSRS